MLSTHPSPRRPGPLRGLRLIRQTRHWDERHFPGCPLRYGTGDECIAPELLCPPPDRPHHVRRAVVRVVIALGCYLGLSLIAYGLTDNALYAALASSLATFVGVVALRRLFAVRFKLAGRAQPSAPVTLNGFWVPVVVAAVLAFLAGQVSAMWWYEHLGSFAYDQSVVDRSQVARPVLWAFEILAAPMGEEAFFRGLLYPMLRRTLVRRLPDGQSRPVAPLVALVATTMTFAVLHGNLVQALAVVPLAMLLGLVYERTERLWPCIVLHAAFNLAAVAIPSRAIAQLAHLPIVLGLVLAVSVFSALLWERSVNEPAAAWRPGE